MSNVIEPPRIRGASQEIRSQVALVLLLNAYAVIGAAMVLRCLLRALGVSDRIWLGDFVYGWTGLLVRPLEFLPGAGFEVHRALTVADLTLLAGVVLFPLGIYARGARRLRGGQ